MVGSYHSQLAKPLDDLVNEFRARGITDLSTLPEDESNKLFEHILTYTTNIANRRTRSNGKDYARRGVDDIASIVALRVFENLASFRGDSDFSRWVSRIVRNATIGEVVRNKHHSGSVLSSGSNRMDSWIPSSEAEPIDGLIQEEGIEKLREAMGSLSDERRQALTLRYRDEDQGSYEAMAAKLGINVGTLRSRLSRGLNELKDILEDGLDDSDAPYLRSIGRDKKRELVDTFIKDHPDCLKSRKIRPIEELVATKIIIEGRTIEEVSGELGILPHSANSHLSEARRGVIETNPRIFASLRGHQNKGEGRG